MRNDGFMNYVGSGEKARKIQETCCISSLPCSSPSHSYCSLSNRNDGFMNYVGSGEKARKIQETCCISSLPCSSGSYCSLSNS